MDSDEIIHKMRMNVEGDRLSSLPDEIIHKILSFMDIKVAIETSVLSSRWRVIWKSMPYLKFSSDDFSTLPKFSKFVTNVLSRRNNLTDVCSMKLRFRVKASHALVKRILNYAFSHNIQQLNVVCALESDIEFPLSLFSSQSLKHLTLIMTLGRSVRYHVNSCFTSTWELPSLTTLHLCYVTLRDDNNADEGISVLSKCLNLKNLILSNFETTGSDGLNIVHPRLSNLTLKNCRPYGKVANVAAPQLKNLTVKFCYTDHFKISALDFVSLIFNSSHPLHLTTEGFHSLEKADICVSSPQDSPAHQIICLLQQLHSVKFLKLNWKIVEILSSSEDLILHQPSPLVNLKSLKIYPERVSLWEQAPKKVAMSTELKRYLLGSSPGATFTMVLHEEVQAQKLMAELRVLLEKENDNSKTNRARLEQGKTPAESHEPKKLEIGWSMVQIKSGLENLGVQLRQSKEKACLIISKLQRVEELLTSLPASDRAKIQPCFSNLCAKADIAISQIIECMKMHCDESQSRSSVCFHNLATTLEPSS